MPKNDENSNKSQENIESTSMISTTEPFDLPIGTTELNQKLSLIIKQIKFSLPKQMKEDFVSFVAKRHNGNVSNYQNLEVIEAIKHYIQSWLEVGEKPVMGNYSLSTNTLPKSLYLERLFLLSQMAKLQDLAYPDKFTIDGLKVVVKLALPHSDRKTIIKYHDFFKALVDVKESEGISQYFDVTRFCETMSRIFKAKDNSERTRIWKNQLGYKFALRTQSQDPEFLNDTTAPKIHARISELLKKQVLAIMSEKYNGKIRQVWSYELSNALKDYMEYCNTPQSKKNLVM